MRRRNFIIVALGGAAAICDPRLLRAQQSSKVYRIAIVSPLTPVSEMNEQVSTPYRAFLSELRRLGHVEGENLSIKRYSGSEWPDKYADGRTEPFGDLAREVVRGDPDVIFVTTTWLTHQLKSATNRIPLVAVVPDPIADGLARSLARPDGNITGATITAGVEIWGKRLELLHEIAPTASKVAYLVPYRVSKNPYAQAIREAAHKIKIDLVTPSLESPVNEPQYRRAFAAMAREGVNAVIVGDQPENMANRKLIGEIAEQFGLPAIYPYPDFTAIGGLIAYGVDLNDVYRRAASQVDQILKGTKAGDIPFYQPTKFALIINLNAAKGLGLTVPESLLARADEVIE